MSEPWTILSVLDWTTQRFGSGGSASARLDAQLLLAFALGCKRMQLYTQFDKPLGEAELTRFRELVKRRLAGEPVAYLLGEQEFWSQPLWVSPAVLIPRRDTETLIEAVIAQWKDVASPRIADVCTGSGAIAIALAKERAQADLVATELSADALTMAARNLERAGVSARVRLLQADLLEGVDGPFDIIVSNPPYIPTADLANLMADVRAEPVMALDGGPDGLVLIRRLIEQAASRLATGGLFAMEHGFDQGAAVRALLVAPTWRDVQTKRDLGGHERVTLARRA